jgi:hypothetical protein
MVSPAKLRTKYLCGGTRGATINAQAGFQGMPAVHEYPRYLWPQSEGKVKKSSLWSYRNAKVLEALSLQKRKKTMRQHRPVVWPSGRQHVFAVLIWLVALPAAADDLFHSSGAAKSFIAALKARDDDAAMVALEPYPDEAHMVVNLISEFCNVSLFVRIAGRGTGGKLFLNKGLLTAVYSGCYPIAESALKRGADPNSKPYANNPTPLEAATQSSNGQIANLLRTYAGVINSSATPPPQATPSAVATAGSSSTNGCPQNLSYMQSSLVSDMRSNPQVIQGLNASIESQIQAAGGVDKAIVLTRIQIDAQQKTLHQSEQCELQSRATRYTDGTNPLDDSSSNIHGSCAKAIKTAKDAIVLNQAALEAFQCYARQRWDRHNTCEFPPVTS